MAQEKKKETLAELAARVRKEELANLDEEAELKKLQDSIRWEAKRGIATPSANGIATKKLIDNFVKWASDEGYDTKVEPSSIYKDFFHFNLSERASQQK
jgi:uncharacterized protein YaaR (DUF327 family)